MRRFLLLLLLAGLALPLAAQAQIAVVVNKGGPDGLTLQQLEQFYLGKATLLPGGKAVALGEYAPLGDAFYKAALRSSSQAVRKAWMSIVLSGGTGTPPTKLDDVDAVKAFVAQHPGAVAFLDAKDADASMKVVAVEGKKPGDAGYPLTK